jgi:hypothetical protein
MKIKYSRLINKVDTTKEEGWQVHHSIMKNITRYQNLIYNCRDGGEFIKVKFVLFYQYQDSYSLMYQSNYF